MRKFGLKLFSTNLNTNPALLEQGIELVKSIQPICLLS